MIHIFELRFDKSALSHVPEAERILYFMLGEVANDLSTLSKQAMFWIQPQDGQSEIHEFARTSAAFLNLKLLAGRIYEAWNLLKKAEHSRVFAAYRQDLDQGALDALSTIKKYFNTTNNLINHLRNKLAFHSDFETVKSAYAALPNEEPLCDFIAQHVGNTFYNSAHLIAVHSAKHLSGMPDIPSALDKTTTEILNLSHLVGLYAHGYASVFAARYLEPLHDLSGPREHQIEDAPRLSEIRTPYFYME